MKYKRVIFLFMSIVLVVSSSGDIHAQPSTNTIEALGKESTSFFDDLEAQAINVHAFDSVEFKEPHPFMVFLRIVSYPILNTYFALTKRIEHSWCLLVNCFRKKACQSSP